MGRTDPINQIKEAFERGSWKVVQKESWTSKVDLPVEHWKERKRQWIRSSFIGSISGRENWKENSRLWVENKENTLVNLD